MIAAVVIPARYASQRLPGKPLAMIGDAPMVVHTARRAAQARGISRVVVATDHAGVFDAARSEGFEAVMTRPDHPSGTDRTAEVAASLDADVVVNVQGDEPLLDPRHVEAVLAPFEDASVEMASLKTPLRRAEDIWNPNTVKVVCDAWDDALYFSRSAIPFLRDVLTPGVDPPWDPVWATVYFTHIGLYAYRRETLVRLAALPPGRLERLEKLEQLRALEAGIAIRVPTVESRSIPVDTPEDLVRVRAMVGSKQGRLEG